MPPSETPGRGRAAVALGLCLLLAAACRRDERVAYLRPEGLSARPGERPGEVVLVFGPVEGATRYRIESAPSRDGPFRRVGEVNGSRAVLAMTPGESYVFRVAAEGPDGRSTWSLLAGCGAPRTEDLWDRLHPPAPAR
ncbi:MAG: fibronectin type III domain-containing protein, partial [Acidobacteria bacterium ACB2]|nr:fibronectin type III domain-containing protein [Acidobacteria bacterium ACB2]